MPEDLEILWVSAVVFVMPVTERGMEWLQGVMPKRYRWDMRLVSHDDIEGMAMAARKQRLSIGGLSIAPEELE